MSDRFTIFLSHKKCDEKIAKELRSILRKPCGKLDIKLMEEIPKGEDWRQWIKANLAEADMLLLLYTDPTLDWNWCLFEAGIFTGSNLAALKRVVCVHDGKSIDLPDQINHLQGVVATEEDVTGFLRSLYVNTVKDWHFHEALAEQVIENKEEALNDLAKRVVALLRRDPIERKPYGEQISIKIPREALAQNAGPARILDNALVSGDGLRKLFSLDETVDHPWSKLAKKLQLDGAGQYHRPWVDGLARAVQAAIDKEYPSTITACYHIPDDANQFDYRPCLHEAVWERDGTIRFSVLFSKEPSLASRSSQVARPIPNFSVLMNELTELLKNADSGTVRMLALTPALGFLARSQPEFEKLKLQILAKAGQIEMITQTPEDLADWHDEFVGRATSQKDLIDRDSAQMATEVSEEMVQAIEASGRCHRLPWTYLPDYYLFSSKERAIIVTPCHLPDLEARTVEALRPALPPVEMFGSITNDASVIKQVVIMADHYLNIKPPPLAAATAS
jgi:hypothetical protein